MGGTRILQCRECGKEYPISNNYFCEDCFGPLDVLYNYDEIKWNQNIFKERPKNLWRYLDLLPISNPKHIVNIEAGFTPLIKADNLGKEIGLKNFYIKNDTVNPTFSFKDRPAGVGISMAVEFGLKSVGCASTGNLAAATAAYAAKAGLPCYVFIPQGLENEKVAQALAYGPHIIEVEGNYDAANRLAAQAADTYNIGVVNINLRTYYVEGSKTLGYEIAEQLNWSLPDHVIVPVGSGALLHALCKGFEELELIGIIDKREVKISAAQGHGCAPLVESFKNNLNKIIPIEHPKTIAKSLAIGEPGDGIYALRKIREYNGLAEDVTNEEIVEAIRLLAQTEGIFSEPAGGVSLGVLKKLVEAGKISPDEKVVCLITGCGLKATEAVVGQLPNPILVEPNLEALAPIIQM